MGTPYKISSRILVLASLRTGIFTVECACPEPFRPSGPLEVDSDRFPISSYGERRLLCSDVFLSIECRLRWWAGGVRIASPPLQSCPVFNARQGGECCKLANGFVREITIWALLNIVQAKLQRLSMLIL
jgi:hypothetical protein